MQGPQNQSQLQQYYPTVYAALKKETSSNPRISTLESLVKELFDNRTLYSVDYSFQSSSNANYAENSFSELTKEIDAYNSKNRTKQYLSGMIAVACVIGIVANSVLGFAALGVALITTINRFPSDQQLHAEKIKSTLYSCESALATHENITYLKGQFEKMQEDFANVAEAFYSNLNTSMLQHPFNKDDTLEMRLEFLEAVVKELNDHSKLVNSEGKLYNSSLYLIRDQFADYLTAENKSNCLQNTKEYIGKVTQGHLDNNTLPQKPVVIRGE